MTIVRWLDFVFGNVYHIFTIVFINDSTISSSSSPTWVRSHVSFGRINNRCWEGSWSFRLGMEQSDADYISGSWSRWFFTDTYTKELGYMNFRRQGFWILYLKPRLPTRWCLYKYLWQTARKPYLVYLIRIFFGKKCFQKTRMLTFKESGVSNWCKIIWLACPPSCTAFSRIATVVPAALATLSNFKT